MSTPSDPSAMVCPECRCEYFASAERCADCGVALVHPDSVVDEEVEELPPVSELVPIRIASVSWMRGFSEMLSEAGLPHRVDLAPTQGEQTEQVRRRSHDQGVAVYVLAEDRERALALDSAYLRAQIPDAPEEASAHAIELSDECCPACGDALAEAAEECSGCGLFVGSGE